MAQTAGAGTGLADFIYLEERTSSSESLTPSLREFVQQHGFIGQAKLLARLERFLNASQSVTQSRLPSGFAVYPRYYFLNLYGADGCGKRRLSAEMAEFIGRDVHDFIAEPETCVDDIAKTFQEAAGAILVIHHAERLDQNEVGVVEWKLRQLQYESDAVSPLQIIFCFEKHVGRPWERIKGSDGTLYFDAYEFEDLAQISR